jgi:hypothetical protein
LEKCFEILEKEKEKEFHFSSWIQPSPAAAQQRAPPVSHVHGPLFSPASAWAEPSKPPLAQLPRTRTFLSFSVIDVADPHIRASSSSPHRPNFLSLYHPIESAAIIFPFLV